MACATSILATSFLAAVFRDLPRFQLSSREPWETAVAGTALAASDQTSRSYTRRKSWESSHGPSGLIVGTVAKFF
ncbi:MAG TPA: hypothetical protein VLA89_11100, partial [Gemmatimonadales bacterium]|nr:hypothetical protein [Gemmatimonadales bacterium]